MFRLATAPLAPPHRERDGHHQIIMRARLRPVGGAAGTGDVSLKRLQLSHQCRRVVQPRRDLEPIALERGDDEKLVANEYLLSGVAFYKSELKGDERSIRCHGRQSIYRAAIDAMRADA